MQAPMCIVYYCIVVISLVFLQLTSAQIPAYCGHNYTIKSERCCPLSRVNGQECGGPTRGYCAPVKIDANSLGGYTKRDDIRLLWPLNIFKQLCKCRGHFYGSACDDCWFGWSGKLCNEKIRKVRRNIKSYSVIEKKQLVAVLQEMRKAFGEYGIVLEAYKVNQPNSWRQANLHEVLTNLHFFSQRSRIYLFNNAQKQAKKCGDNDLDFAHSGLAFLLFHRHFMLLWEKWAAQIAMENFGIENFALPYWDWTDKKTCEMCVNNIFGAPGKPSPDESQYIDNKSPFSKWKVYCDLLNPKEDLDDTTCTSCFYSQQGKRLTRKLTNLVHPFPTSDQIKFTLTRPNFFSGSLGCYSLADALEGSCRNTSVKLEYTMHNQVHNSFGGDFMSSATSVNDPIFIVHHLQIDRIFQAWWMLHRKQPNAFNYPNYTFNPGHCRYCYQVGFIPVIPHDAFFRDTRELGYEYDSYAFSKEN